MARSVVSLYLRVSLVVKFEKITFFIDQLWSSQVIIQDASVWINTITIQICIKVQD